MPDIPPRILIIAGSNGAGKTTVVREFLSREPKGTVFLNADDIAREMNQDNPEAAAIAAGREMLARLEAMVAAGKSFIFETTLSGRGYLARIPRWREAGFRVELVFLEIPTVEMSIRRVAERVRHGGHDIPEPVIRRRFEAGLRNFHELYKPIVDGWLHLDNSTKPYQVVDKKDDY